jgi:hypothetical protein
MILVARNVAEELAAYAEAMEATPLFTAARTLPGYETYRSAIEAQYEIAPHRRSVRPSERNGSCDRGQRARRDAW